MAQHFLKRKIKVSSRFETSLACTKHYKNLFGDWKMFCSDANGVVKSQTKTSGCNLAVFSAFKCGFILEPKLIT